jgi:enoyl-CoA hydratase/carnithine racemase
VGQVRIEERAEGVLVATIDNPPFALMTDEIVAGLEALSRRAQSDPEVRGIVLTGAHPDRFVAHYEVTELLAGARASPPIRPGPARGLLSAVAAVRRVPGAIAAMAGTQVAGLSDAERFGEVLSRFESSGAVMVAALNGSAMGGGCELSLACDFRIMAEGPFHIGQPEILLGFPPGGGGTQRLTRLLGTGPALRICLEGAPLSPREAKEAGIVDEVVPHGEVLERAVALAARLGRRAKAGVAAVKRAVYRGGALPMGAGLRLERAEFMAALVTREAAEAMARYVEATERTGDLPLYDDGARERALERGRFV